MGRRLLSQDCICIPIWGGENLGKDFYFVLRSFNNSENRKEGHSTENYAEQDIFLSQTQIGQGFVTGHRRWGDLTYDSVLGR